MMKIMRTEELGTPRKPQRVSASHSSKPMQHTVHASMVVVARPITALLPIRKAAR